MGQDDSGLRNVKKLKKDLEPSIYLPIWNTIICSGPPLNLIFRYYLEKDMKNPTVAIILTVVAMIWTSINWYWYVKVRKNFKRNWEESSLDLHTLNLEEKTSKDIMDTVFNISSITAIASLVTCIVSLAVAILSGVSFFKYFVIFCIVIFFIASGILIIVGIIQLFGVVRYLIKYGRFKKVLLRFTLIYILSFTMLFTINSIIHKSPEWIEFVLRSLMITFPISLSIEAFKFYKELKKEYSLNTSSDESDRK